MSSRIQEAANWSWLVPKDLGPKALFGCSASPAWAELMASAKHWLCGVPQDRNLPSCPRHLNVPWRMARRPAWPFGGGRGTGDRADTTPRQWSRNSGATVGTRHAKKKKKNKKRGSANKGPSEAGGGGHETASPPPPPHPEAFSKPQAEPYCRSQAKFNF